MNFHILTGELVDTPMFNILFVGLGYIFTSAISVSDIPTSIPHFKAQPFATLSLSVQNIIYIFFLSGDVKIPVGGLSFVY